jgi:hypothetical protein
MKKFLFGLIAVVAFSVSGFAESGKPKVELVNHSVASQTTVVILNECATCPDNCCAVLVTDPNGGTKAFKACCAQIKVTRIPQPKQGKQ